MFTAKNLQNILTIMVHNLAFYTEGFHGWSALTRRVFNKYGLPDPLSYLQYPWRPDRWRKHCKQIVGKHWEQILKDTARQKDSLEYFDIDSSSIFKPTQNWALAGLDSLEVKMATIVNWMQLGVYKTREKLHQFKLVKEDICLSCNLNQKENLYHLIFVCPFYDNIRQPSLSRIFLMNPSIVEVVENARLKMIVILDPQSKLLPDVVRESWKQNVSDVFKITRRMLYNIHKKREKFYAEKDKT